jgi:hypothetical protein
MNLAGYLMVIVTVFLFFKKEAMDNENLNVMSVYKDMWKVVCLPSMRTLFFVMLTGRIAFAAADNTTMLKLREKGFPQQMLALSVVITFPFEIFFPILLGRMAQRTPHKSLGPVSQSLRITCFLICLPAVHLCLSFQNRALSCGNDDCLSFPQQQRSVQLALRPSDWTSTSLLFDFQHDLCVTVCILCKDQ